MAATSEHPEAGRLAREPASTTGETLTDAVLTSLRERSDQGRLVVAIRLSDELRAIRERCALLPVLDPRSAVEILGYD